MEDSQSQRWTCPALEHGQREGETGRERQRERHRETERQSGAAENLCQRNYIYSALWFVCVCVCVLYTEY